MGRFIPLPPMFFDPFVSDAELQERWTAGAEGEVRRLKARIAELETELASARASLVEAETFAFEAQQVRQRYRSSAAAAAAAAAEEGTSARASIREVKRLPHG